MLENNKTCKNNRRVENRHSPDFQGRFSSEFGKALDEAQYQHTEAGNSMSRTAKLHSRKLRKQNKKMIVTKKTILIKTENKNQHK